MAAILDLGMEKHSPARTSRPKGNYAVVLVLGLVFWLTFQHVEFHDSFHHAQCPTTTIDQKVLIADTPAQSHAELHSRVHVAKSDGNDAAGLHEKAERDVAVQDMAMAQSVFMSPEMANAFPARAEVVKHKEDSKSLPDIVNIPFEESAAEVTLQGWEDEWISNARFDVEKWGSLSEPKIDFVYNWVNGSDDAFKSTKLQYELNSTLNDANGEWLSKHSVNRYRDWDELRYSFRSLEANAAKFLNKIQILVNTVKDFSAGGNVPEIREQRPTWLKDDETTRKAVEVLRQEDFFGEKERQCLPTFNSLTIENQIFNTKSDVDRLFSLSDDMLLGLPHSASDIYSPLFGPAMGFKVDAFNQHKAPGSSDAAKFGEKPYLIYTSWLLNRRFGERKRRGQVHFGHSLSRNVTREAMATFPRPAAISACERFRGEGTGFQLYSWYATFHYTMERFREALLWSYIAVRADPDQDGYFSWSERQAVIADLKKGMANEAALMERERMFFRAPQMLAKAGLEPPKVNVDIQWTSLDGPVSIKDVKCENFDIDMCLAEGFSSPASDKTYRNPAFSTASVFDRLSRQDTECGDCFIKLLLATTSRGLAPMLPDAASQPEQRQVVVKSLMKYQYTVVEPDAQFIMVKDPEQARNVLLERMLYRGKKVGQMCLNDDVATEDEKEVGEVKEIVAKVFETMFPEKGAFEK